MDDFRAELARSGAPVAQLLQPGLTPVELDALTAPLDLSLPAEAKQWFGWQNGVAVGHGETTAPGTFGRYWLAPVEYLVEECRMMRDVEAELGDDAGWQDDWFSFVVSDSRSNIPALDCSDPERAEVVAYDQEDPDPPDRMALGDVIDLWARVLRDGIWRWDSGSSGWVPDQGLMRDASPAESQWQFV